ncbi:helix-turn-helix domain-containing protein [Pelagibacterium mangrovi]|uniref:helix-turn-helix domain-containing protein n=1 Tax=Pelagibacterium mangrovi TaxID=3119828 RepID=UPI002FC59F2B
MHKSNDHRTDEGPISGQKGAKFLRSWRDGLALSREKAAESLGLSLRMYAYYEAGEKNLPVKVFLACNALSRGKTPHFSLPRERWARTVDRLVRYALGENVVGPMVRQRQWQALRDFMDVIKFGPEPELAMTDPALFAAIRTAGTKAYLSGLMAMKGPSDDVLDTGSYTVASAPSPSYDDGLARVP